MTYKEAKNKVTFRRLFGITTAIVFLAVTLTSIMKQVHNAPDGSIFFGITNLIKRTISLIYHNVPFLPFLWEYSPKVDMHNVLSPNNINFLIYYMGMAAGLFIFQSGNAIAVRLKNIESRIQDEIIYDSLRPGPKRSSRGMKESVDISTPSLWETIHSSYVAPLMVTVVGGCIIAAFGWN